MKVCKKRLERMEGSLFNSNKKGLFFYLLKLRMKNDNLLSLLGLCVLSLLIGFILFVMVGYFVEFDNKRLLVLCAFVINSISLFISWFFIFYTKNMIVDYVNLKTLIDKLKYNNDLLKKVMRLYNEQGFILNVQKSKIERIIALEKELLVKQNIDNCIIQEKCSN